MDKYQKRRDLAKWYTWRIIEMVDIIAVSACAGLGWMLFHFIYLENSGLYSILWGILMSSAVSLMMAVLYVYYLIKRKIVKI